MEDVTDVVSQEADLFDDVHLRFRPLDVGSGAVDEWSHSASGCITRGGSWWSGSWLSQFRPHHYVTGVGTRLYAVSAWWVIKYLCHLSACLQEISIAYGDYVHTMDGRMVIIKGD